MKHAPDRRKVPAIVCLAVLGWASGALAGGEAGQAPPGSSAVRYRVNYRPSGNDPWQLYAETRSLAKANTIATSIKESGYQAQVVDDLTPAPQPYPDASQTSASRYY